MQMDTMKIGPGMYQYTLIDDYSRFVYAEIYPTRSAKSTLEFLEFAEDSLVYPIVRLQTDNGSEFTAAPVWDYLLENCIRWRPIAPGKPHLNGKVERVQRTIWDELYSRLNLKTANVADELGDYLIRYNYRRIHGSLATTPAERERECIWDAPMRYDAQMAFNPTYERWLMRERERKQMKRLLK